MRNMNIGLTMKDDDWLNAVSNLFDSYTYDVENTDVDKFKMSDVMNVYRIINL